MICYTVHVMYVHTMYVKSSAEIPHIIFSNKKHCCSNRQLLSQKLQAYMNNLLSDSGSSEPLVFIFSKIIIPVVDLRLRYKTINYNPCIWAQNEGGGHVAKYDILLCPQQILKVFALFLFLNNIIFTQTFLVRI